MADDEAWVVFVAAGLVIAFTFVWMGIQIACLLRFLRAPKEEGPASKAAVALWLVASTGVFTGPCVAVFSLVGVIGGAVVLARGGNPPTRAAALGALASSGTMLLMTLLMLGILAVGGVFG